MEQKDIKFKKTFSYSPIISIGASIGIALVVVACVTAIVLGFLLWDTLIMGILCGTALLISIVSGVIFSFKSRPYSACGDGTCGVCYSCYLKSKFKNKRGADDDEADDDDFDFDDDDDDFDEQGYREKSYTAKQIITLEDSRGKFFNFYIDDQFEAEGRKFIAIRSVDKVLGASKNASFLYEVTTVNDQSNFRIITKKEYDEDISKLHKSFIVERINTELLTVEHIDNMKLVKKQIGIEAVKFSDIAGLTEAKQALEEKAILPIKHKDIFAKYGKTSGGGILLYGLPGTGKTMFAKAVATELEAEFIPIKCSDIESKWVGEAEKNVRQLFERARKFDRAVIFFDEFDTIGKKRSEQKHDNTVQEILAHMQGVEEQSGNLLVLSATNAPWMLDSALLRPGRFSDKIYIPLPDKEAREFMLKKGFENCNIDKSIDLIEVAKGLAGYSGADIFEITQKVKMLLIKKEIAKLPKKQTKKKADESIEAKTDKKQSQKSPVLSKEEFDKILTQVKPSNLSSDVETMDKYAKKQANKDKIGF